MEIGPAAGAVGQALDGFATALDHLVKAVEDGGLGDLDQTGLLAVSRGYERVRRRMPLIDHRLVSQLEGRGTADTLGQPSTAALLAWLLRVSRGEATRRVRAAEQLGARTSTTGEVLSPLRPALAAAQRDGEASAEQVDVCLRALAQVDHRGFDPADLDRADGLLAGFAGTFPPAELRQLAQQVVDRIDPDGTLPDEQVQSDRRHLALRKTRDGAWTLEGRLTGTAGAKLTAVLAPLSAPRIDTAVGDDSRQLAAEDVRHHGQRLHDALEEVCDRLLRSDTLPDLGGVRRP
jgi:hypothetical protein